MTVDELYEQYASWGVKADKESWKLGFRAAMLYASLIATRYDDPVQIRHAIFDDYLVASDTTSGN